MNTIKILIVDDELIGRQLLHAILIVEGYETILASNGEEAIKMAKQHNPKLILLDIMMPVITGYEVTKTIRQDQNLKNTPIILVSALEDRNSKAKGLNAGANDFISKPFDKSEVISKIKKHLLPL